VAEQKTPEFTHFDADGNAVMVDVSGKNETHRTAVATGSILVTEDILQAVQNKTMKKGDVLGVARVAGIMAVKQTSSIIPLCHPLPITKASVDFTVDADTNTITALCTVQCDGKTGVEMEALHGCTAALLTVYDMCKAVSKQMVLSDIHLVTKTGGKSGNFAFDEE
jgi:cyclic pyranopterin phosphate synthase